jgi:hypothetical protein
MKHLLFIVLIFFTLASLGAPCGRLSGKWNGSGKFSHWLVGECVYDGVWTTEALTTPGQFLLRVDIHKKSGSIFCPRRGKTKFKGFCDHGNITIQTGRGVLRGTIAKTEGNAQGTIYILPGLGGTLKVKFVRGGSAQLKRN